MLYSRVCGNCDLAAAAVVDFVDAGINYELRSMLLGDLCEAFVEVGAVDYPPSVSKSVESPPSCFRHNSRISQISLHIWYHPCMPNFRSISPPHIELFKVHQVLTNHIRNTIFSVSENIRLSPRRDLTPFYQQSRHIRRHLNTRSNLSQLRSGFQQSLVRLLDRTQSRLRDHRFRLRINRRGCLVSTRLSISVVSFSERCVPCFQC